MTMERLIFSWDYTDWPVFSSPDSDDTYPDIHSQISSELASELTRWAQDMGRAYSDETGSAGPSQSTADELDARFDALTSRLGDEGIDVEQGPRWWRR